jgi:REP element-mobilizing transposase RayT
MGNTYTSLNYHIIFSTKDREGWMSAAIRERLHPYFGGIARENAFTCLLAGGTEDHVHILAAIPPALAVAKAVQLLKGGSSHWLHEQFPQETGSWQDGYGAFTVSRSMVEQVEHYIAGQLDHHRRLSFQEEYREFLKRHDIEIDERYVWG